MLALAACTGNRNATLGGSTREVLDQPPAPIEDLDILFVIDTSGSMLDNQRALIASAEESLFGQLALEVGGMPSIHLAVVSTDVGAGPFNISGCIGHGDDGQFRMGGSDMVDCGVDGWFLTDVRDDDGSRITNYQGTLGETFACMAALGTNGCGFEQPFEAARRALDGSHPENDGFLRDEAMLLVVVLTDEDDCSARDTMLFDPSQNSVNDPLGPFASYRCFDFGVVCSPDEPRVPGVKEGCTSREDSPYLQPLADYAAFFASLKPDPTMVMIAGIFGSPDHIEVFEDGYGTLDLADVCAEPLWPPGQAPDAAPPPAPSPPDASPFDESTPDAGTAADAGPAPAPVPETPTAAPAVRLTAIGELFPARYSFQSICTPGMTEQLAAIARDTGAVMSARPCLRGHLADTNSQRAGVQPYCHAYDVLAPRTADEERTKLPACSGSGDTGCYRLIDDPDECGDTPSQLKVDVVGARPAEAHVVVECMVPSQ